jgi:polyisoprenoid-binding protein YceI
VRKPWIAISALAVAVTSASAAEVYVVDKGRSEAKFEVRYFYQRITGRMRDIHGGMVLDPANPGASSVNFSIIVASLDTGSTGLNEQLRSAYVLDAAKFSKITFQSTSITPTARMNVYQVTGELTLHGVTRSVTLPVELVRILNDAAGLARAWFLVRTTLNRRDYGITWNGVLDRASLLVGEDVKLTVNLVASKKVATPKNGQGHGAQAQGGSSQVHWER